jgi:hypothetical protein
LTALIFKVLRETDIVQLSELSCLLTILISPIYVFPFSFGALIVICTVKAPSSGLRSFSWDGVKVQVPQSGNDSIFQSSREEIPPTF